MGVANMGANVDVSIVVHHRPLDVVMVAVRCDARALEDAACVPIREIAVNVHARRCRDDVDAIDPAAVVKRSGWWGIGIGGFSGERPHEATRLEPDIVGARTGQTVDSYCLAGTEMIPACLSPPFALQLRDDFPLEDRHDGVIGWADGHAEFGPQVPTISARIVATTNPIARSGTRTTTRPNRRIARLGSTSSTRAGASRSMTAPPANSISAIPCARSNIPAATPSPARSASPGSAQRVADSLVTLARSMAGLRPVAAADSPSRWTG